MALHVQNLQIKDRGNDILRIADWRIDTPAQGLITGPSGSGKTTLLYALSGLRPIANGTIDLNGQRIEQMKPAVRDAWRGRQIGFVFQDLHIIPHLTVQQNITLAASLTGFKIDTDWLDKIVDLLGLKNLLQRRGLQLSTGEKQRVAIARAIATRPNLILADEPTSGLDDTNAHNVASLLKQAAAFSHATLLIATHDRRLEQDFPVLLHIGGRS